MMKSSILIQPPAVLLTLSAALNNNNNNTPLAIIIKHTLQLQGRVSSATSTAVSNPDIYGHVRHPPHRFLKILDPSVIIA